MCENAPCVRVVDDDAAVLKSLDRLLRSAGFAVRTFSSSEDLLQEQRVDTPGCVVLDVSMPGIHGVELRCPVIFMSGDADAPAKAGAVGFLAKPFDREQLLAAVRAAIEKDRRARAARS